MKSRPFTRSALLVSCFSLGFAAMVQLGACSSDRPAGADNVVTNPVPNGSVLTGPCTTEGQVAECHVETSRVGNIVNCFSGAQVCHEGVWGPCGGAMGTGGTLSSKSLSASASGLEEASGGGLHIQAVVSSDASAEAGACASNPCNPYCSGIDTDAGGLKPDGGFVSFSIAGAVVDPSNFPAGVTGPKSAASHGITGSPAYFQCTAPPPQPPLDFQDCSYDFCCAASGPLAGKCVDQVLNGSDNPQVAACIKPAPVDFTAGIGCTDSVTGHLHLPVCNRGQTAAPMTGTLPIGFYAGNPNSYGTSDVCTQPGSPNETCSVDLSKIAIPPGKCIDVDVSVLTGIFHTCTGSPSGNRTVMVNPGIKVAVAIGKATSAGTTVTLDLGTTAPGPRFAAGNTVTVSGITPAGYNGTYTIASATGTSPYKITYTVPSAPGGASTVAGSVVAGPLAEADLCNNYSFFQPVSQGGTCVAYGSQPPPPAAYTYNFTGTCPPGTALQWNQFAYDTSVGNSGEVIFKVSTAPLTADGGTGTFSAPVQIADIKTTATGTAPDPQVCAINGAPDAAVCPKNLATALGSAAYNPILQVSVTEIAITAIPVVNGWNASYNCVPNE